MSCAHCGLAACPGSDGQPCTVKHACRHCWHDVPFSFERVCCDCGEREALARSAVRFFHGPHMPRPIVTLNPGATAVPVKLGG